VKKNARVFAVVIALVTAAPAAAQVAWDAPLLLAPGSPGGLGIFLIEPQGPELPPALGIDDDGFGVVGTWRASSAPGVGFRAGIAEDPFDDIAVLGGIDLSGTLFTPTEEIPVGFIWVLGAGLSIGDEVLALFPAGISAGIDVETEGILFRPYMTPRVDLSLSSFEGSEADLNVSVDLGLDLSFTDDWVIRFAASLGNGEAIAIGLAFPGLSLEID
jgi:hypothetical protein